MHKIFILSVLFILSACSGAADRMGKPLPSLDYSALTPYAVQQGRVEVRKSYTEYERPTQASFVRSPEFTIENYALSRFDLVTGVRRMVFDIQKLSLIRQEQKLKYFDSFFGNKRDVYQFNLFVTMIPVQESGTARAPYTIDIDRTLTLTPDLSIAEREFRQFEFLEKAMSDLDKAVSDIVTKINLS